MEFLSSAFEGRALLFGEDTDFTIDGLTSGRNLLKNLNGEDAVENIGFIEPLLPNTTISSASFLDDQCLDKTIANDDKFAAAKQSKGNMFSADNSVLPSPKRAKSGDLQPPIPTCQVYGCNKDLSSSKDYHKRHKVCDLHSKTAVVVVNGIRQRFCQQCSRFHVLAEFDEGKRSCRKRLAGHNERRRKPQFNAHFRDTSKALIFSRILGLQSNYPTHLKLEEKPFPRLSQSLPKSVLRFHGMGKQYPSKNCLNSPSELYASSASGCALSLLSGNDHFNLSTPQSCSSNGYGVGVGSKTPQGAKTVNLLELSLHLQRVEQQKNYGQVKMESDDVFDSTIV